MHLRLIRHATMILEMGGKRFLIDPMFAPPGGFPSLTLGKSSRRNPCAPLPVPVEDLCNPDAVVATHLHFDHFDRFAARLLPKTVPIICQRTDRRRLARLGFDKVLPVGLDPVQLAGIRIRRTGGRHGRGLLRRLMGHVSGFVFEAPGEPTVYLAGDTIWCPSVRRALERHHPDIVVVNAGAARFNLGAPITMTARDVVDLAACAPQALIVAVHMEAVNHCRLTRAALRTALEDAGLASRVRIPADGETVIE